MNKNVGLTGLAGSASAENGARRALMPALMLVSAGYLLHFATAGVRRRNRLRLQPTETPQVEVTEALRPVPQYQDTYSQLFQQTAFFGFAMISTMLLVVIPMLVSGTVLIVLLVGVAGAMARAFWALLDMVLATQPVD